MKDWITKGAFFSAAFLMIALPLSKALISIGVVALILFAIAHFFDRRPALSIPQIIMPFGLMIIFYIISLFHSEDWLNGLKEINIQHTFVTIPLCITILSVSYTHLTLPTTSRV